ncbi:Bifunctional inhibitor/lipid-transfer protein/seed storage 2S albumin superfamily protein [Salvia divinorum]
MGACVDLFGGLVHIGLGDPAAHKCCPMIAGLIEIEAAMCLCTTLRIKALSLNLYIPLALQFLVTCGKTPPPGYNCFF